jgi:hypothetical protein
MSMFLEVSKAYAASDNQCAHCYGKLSLIRRLSGGTPFCSAVCEETHHRKVNAAVEAKNRWYAYLRHADPRSA